MGKKKKQNKLIIGSQVAAALLGGMVQGVGSASVEQLADRFFNLPEIREQISLLQTIDHLHGLHNDQPQTINVYLVLQNSPVPRGISASLATGKNKSNIIAIEKNKRYPFSDFLEGNEDDLGDFLFSEEDYEQRGAPKLLKLGETSEILGEDKDIYATDEYGILVFAAEEHVTLDAETMKGLLEEMFPPDDLE